MICLFIFTLSVFSVDSAITYKISEGLKSPISDFVFNTATLSGNRENILLYSAIFTAFGDSVDILHQKGAIIGGAITSGACALIKYITNRKRPDGISSRWNSSFPSGHATMSSFLAVYFGDKYPKYRGLFYAWAMLVGVSRIYLNRHWFSDVIAGYTLGIGGAYLTIKLYDVYGNR